MMDGFSPEVRAGLVNLIFSTYENDARACCDALEQMGILKVTYMFNNLNFVSSTHETCAHSHSIVIS
jgi:hypothetical protein